MDALRRVGLLAWKDVVVEARSKELLGAMFVFSLLVVVIFSFALDPSRSEVRPFFPGILWVAVFFAGVLGLNRSFSKEMEDRALWGMMLIPMDRSTVYYAKALSTLLLMLFTEAVVLPLFFVLLGQTLTGDVALFALAILLGSIGFTLSGTLLSALAASTRSGEILLPILLFPLLVPVVLGVVEITQGILLGLDPAGWLKWFQLLGAYDLLFLVVPLILFEQVIEL
ncbi:heme exporter protein CcmB [Limnochorda pilosa]|uniref:Heme exporter protein B n=1 Tax=Limnochorda pilosa TaxID=1555112 RepID=A0A0K2SJS3_LIMPI|nr:heme exporter protein CcmB [Limnochorda pilosa]BAS27257.1 transcriptional regulator [Limnochorda pilosa]